MIREENVVEGTILSVKKDKSLVLSNDNNYYIILHRVADYIGEKVKFKKEDALFMPSYLYAIATLAEDDLDKTLDEIKENWFKHLV